MMYATNLLGRDAYSTSSGGTETRQRRRGVWGRVAYLRDGSHSMLIGIHYPDGQVVAFGREEVYIYDPDQPMPQDPPLHWPGLPPTRKTGSLTSYPTPAPDPRPRPWSHGEVANLLGRHGVGLSDAIDIYQRLHSRFPPDDDAFVEFLRGAQPGTFVTIGEQMPALAQLLDRHQISVEQAREHYAASQQCGATDTQLAFFLSRAAPGSL